MRRLLILGAFVVGAGVLLPAALTAARIDSTHIGHGNKRWHTRLDLPVAVNWKWHCDGAGNRSGFELDAIHPDNDQKLHAFVDSVHISGHGSVAWRGSGRMIALRFRVRADSRCNWTVHYKDQGS